METAVLTGKPPLGQKPTWPSALWKKSLVTDCLRRENTTVGWRIASGSFVGSTNDGNDIIRIGNEPGGMRINDDLTIDIIGLDGKTDITIGISPLTIETKIANITSRISRPLINSVKELGTNLGRILGPRGPIFGDTAFGATNQGILNSGRIRAGFSRFQGGAQFRIGIDNFHINIGRPIVPPGGE